MDIAIIENGVVAAIGDYRALFPNTSFPSSGPDQEFLESVNALRVNLWKPHDWLTEELAPCTPYVEDGWVYRVVVQALTPERILGDKNSAMSQLRATRNALLTGSDWTQIEDCTADKVAWAAYRQALRGFPPTVADARLPYTMPNDPNWVERV